MEATFRRAGLRSREDPPQDPLPGPPPASHTFPPSAFCFLANPRPCRFSERETWARPIHTHTPSGPRSQGGKSIRSGDARLLPADWSQRPSAVPEDPAEGVDGDNGWPLISLWSGTSGCSIDCVWHVCPAMGLGRERAKCCPLWGLCIAGEIAD